MLSENAFIYWSYPKKSLLNEWSESVVLDDEEKIYLASLRNEVSAISYLSAHTLLRYALSQHFSLPPKEWRFSKNKSGKPILEHPKQYESVHFNLSHSSDVVACIISEKTECGIDVESNIDTTIFNHTFGYLHEFEIDYINKIDKGFSKAQSLKFYEIWTLKEAYSKALGHGVIKEWKAFSMCTQDGHLKKRFSKEEVVMLQTTRLYSWQKGRFTLGASLLNDKDNNIFIKQITL